MITNRSADVLAAAKQKGAEQVREFCDIMADHAREGSPVDTGHNRDSINYEVNEMQGRVYTESGYGGWLEVGTSRMAAQPYFRPAYEATKGVMS